MVDGEHHPNLMPTFASHVYDFFNSHPKMDIAFTDRETVEWAPIPGAEEYWMIRRDDLDFQDADENGLPDQGYGVYLPDSDADLTNLVFADPQVPLPGEGFGYLMRYKDDFVGQGGGIGKTGQGKHRPNP
jgi:hypothetical protein